MYADVTPIQVELMPEGTATLTVRISNPSTTIDAYDISLFGLDPSWVRVERGEVQSGIHCAGDRTSRSGIELSEGTWGR